MKKKIHKKKKFAKIYGQSFDLDTTLEFCHNKKQKELMLQANKLLRIPEREPKFPKYFNN